MSLLTFNVNVQPKLAAGALLTLDVDVSKKALQPAGSLLAFDVEVKGNQPAGELLGFDVYVKKPPVNQRWEAVVVLDGVDISGRVAGSVSVGGQIGQNKTAGFQIKNPSGVVDPLEFINKQLKIDYIQPDGTVNRIFTGWVEKPTYQVETGRTLITASTLKDKRLDGMSRDQLNALIGGEHSDYLFDPEAEGAAYAANLLRTVEADLQIDAKGVMRMVPWSVGSPDFVLNGGNISEYQLGVTLQDAESLVNKISVSVEYRYTRLRHREQAYRWEAPGHNYWGDYMIKPYPLVSKGLIRSAIDSTAWQLVGDIAYQDVPGVGSFTVNGKNQIWLNANSANYATAADFTLATRFTQTITEKYSLSFEAPESVEVWGEVPASARSHGVTAEFADDEWDDAQLFNEKPVGSVQSPNGDWIIDATDVEEGGRNAFETAFALVLKMYRRELVSAHRQNYVDLLLPKKLYAEIDTHHTVQIVTAEVSCTARVFSVNHEFDRVSGRRQTRLRLVLSRAPASGVYSATALNLPSVPNTDDQALTPSTIKLGVHLGNAYGAGELNESWQGYISNYLYYDKVDTLEQYPTAFVVVTPAVEAADRDEREAKRSKNYNVLIPNDPLVITNTKQY